MSSASKPDDVIIIHDQNNSGDLEAFVHYGYGANPFMVKIVLISKSQPIKELGSLQLLYLSKAGWEAMRNFNHGAVPLVVPVCLSSAPREVDPSKMVAVAADTCAAK
jgi:hypothetical protein